MALIAMDGFDKYGAANSNSTAVAALLTAGEWTSAGGSAVIVAPLSATGQALRITTTMTVAKTLGASYARLIGGVRFSSDLTGTNCGVLFSDAGTAQASVSINSTTGLISIRNGGITGTAIATSVVSVSANTTHYLEWDVTFGNSAAFQVWLDGVSILSGSGDTTATANNTANGIALASASVVFATFDDLYLFDATGTTNNASLLTSPRIETQFPNADGAVQFAVGAAILGTSVPRVSGNVSSTANQWRVRPFTPTRNMTLNSVSFTCNAASASVNLRPIVYTDSAGAPGTLMSAGSTVVGAVIGPVTMPLTTPQSLIAGTQYWLGLMCDIAVTSLMSSLESGLTDRTATATFASGAPGTAPANSTNGATVIWGNVTLASPVNWYEVSQNPTQGSSSYLFDPTIGHEDLYAFPALSAPPSAIYAVAVKASLSKSDAGAKTASVRLKSGSTDSAGTGGTALAPGTSFGWMTSHYERDPNGNIAWTKTALDAAQAGVKVET